MTRGYYFLRWCVIFAKALIKANIDVAKIVLSPTMSIRPGFVEVPMEAETDLEITLLANAITLTPGTITVHVDRDERTLLVHALDVGADPELIRRDVRDTLEANILVWTRPPHGRGALVR
jgi:multicomponent Na+:H+ antiporter subunit E